MRRNFDLSAVLAALGAVIVIVALFFEWYDPGLTAFEAFEVVDWALLGLALAALAILATESLASAPPSGRLPWVAGAIGLLVLAQIIDAPPAAAGAERELGAWLALAGVVLLGLGVALALLRISVTIDVAERERRRRMRAVDARGDDDSAGAGGSTAASAATAGGLWKRPDDAESKGRVEGESSPAQTAGPGAAQPDPDRTQPLPTTERPARDG